MRQCIISLIIVVLFFHTELCRAQVESSSDNLIVKAELATTWSEGAVNIVQLEGPLTIDLDRTRLTASKAVIWLSPGKNAVLEEQHAEIALIGEAGIDQQGQVQRTGTKLFVTANIKGVIRVTAEKRSVENLSKSELHQVAMTMRPLRDDAKGIDIDNWLLTPVQQPTTFPTTQRTKRTYPIAFSSDKVETTNGDDGNVAIVITGNVKLFQKRAGDDLMELQADRAVLFTPLKSLRDIEKSDKYSKVEEAITSAYLEGDVRIVHTPGIKKTPDQRMAANRVYYDFETDRAVLTDAVIHTIEPKKNIPIVIRAKIVRQLSVGEYKGEKVILTQSSFKTPSYHIGMKQAYIRQYDSGDERYGSLTTFKGTGTTFNAFGLPYFYLPYIGGSFSERGAALRDVGLEGGSKFGFGVTTTWGLFETLGKIPPKDLDMQFKLDYFNERGPALGLDAEYGGGFITENTREPWSFNGKFTSYAVNDHGTEELGRRRLDIEPSQEFRYRVAWEHQHFLPDHWQAQVTLAIYSDPTFYEQWFKKDFDGSRPQDSAFYIKRQDQTEAFTFLTSFQLNDFVTTSELQQEQAEIERLPEISYRRIGDALGDEGLTFFSDNSFSALRFQNSSFTLPEQGFRNVDSPGIASFGGTGTPSDVNYRADFRQELDFPVTLGQFRFVPYVIGRYTYYSQSADDEGSVDRLFAAAGMRLTTAFWKVDDSAKSEFWNIHRLRHVVEPEVNLFTSAQSTDRGRLLQYDEGIDEINDISAFQVAVRQRWQTKRGGAGRWRSVDFFSFNVEGNFFFNAPPDAELAPTSFRGLFFSSMPEASIPRNGINFDATWRVSDTTAILADAAYNIDESSLATASIGMAASRDTRMGYFLGLRYIEELNSVVATAAANYQVTPKYTLAGRIGFDFGERERVLSHLSVIRQFDRWYASLTFRVDYIGEDSGIFFNIWPEGLGAASASAERLQGIFR